MVDKIGQINRLIPGLVEPGAAKPVNIGGNKTEQSGFAGQLASIVDSVNDLQAQSGEVQNAFLSGEPVELHDVMLKAEEAGLAMDLLLEIRNRLLDGYKEIMRMPV